MLFVSPLLCTWLAFFVTVNDLLMHKKRRDSKKGVFIRKSTGEVEAFLPSKLRNSLKRSGAGAEAIDQVMAEVLARMHNGMTTRDIYTLAYRLLKRESKPVAIRYKLRQAVIDLGPTGHPFERLIGEVFRIQEYAVQVGVLVQGRCVMHEVDVVAQKPDHHALAECKFHNRPGEKSDVKTAMYVHARFEDIRTRYGTLPALQNVAVRPWLITNTKLSSDAITYGECMGLHLLAWDYPTNGNLQHLIEQHHLYPVTSLTCLSSVHKRLLVQEGIILVRDLRGFPDILRRNGLDEAKVTAVMREADMMLHQDMNNATRIADRRPTI